MDSTTLDRILSSVRKPSTYIGNEPNSIKKDYSGINGSMALVFPDLYEIGMSHLGLKILYQIINSHADLAAERLFAPGDDFADELKREKIPLFTLESKRAVASFDVVGFTIPYELSYTTILWILDLSRITRRVKDRRDDEPMVIGGGAGVYNPEPIAEFFDLFVMGDGENVTVEILRKTTAMPGATRKEKLRELSRIEGVYVPSLFEVSYLPDGSVEKIAPLEEDYPKAKRIFLTTLSESSHPVNMVTPTGGTVQERVSVEIDRGCTQGCRFCQAGITYRPTRERTPGEVKDIMDKTLANTGYGEVSLVSLSAGDYSRIEELLTLLMDSYESKNISVSLPSLRSETVTDNIATQASRVRKSGVTITAEAGSQRLRNVINKKATEEEILNAGRRFLNAGWRRLKLYFMIGLPTETSEDVDAIFHLAEKFTHLREGQNKFQNITVAVSNFVPKSHTPFQWVGQDKMETLIDKKERLFQLIRQNRKLKLKYHDPKMSHMEAVFSRGDRRLSKVVESAYTNGARLDPWTERFDFERWMKAFEENRFDSISYANRAFELDETLPWDMIDTGVTKRFLSAEWQNAIVDVMTGDCKTDKCLACGLNPKVCFSPYEYKGEVVEKKTYSEHSTGRFKYRLIYSKTGLAGYFSHLEIKGILERAVRMADIPVAYSQGFSPHLKISYGPATGTGVKSLEEFVEMELTESKPVEEFLHSLNARLPYGILFVSCNPFEEGEKSVFPNIEGYEYLVTFTNNIEPGAIEEAVARFINSPSVTMTKERVGKPDKVIDLKLLVDKIVADKDSDGVRFVTTGTTPSPARPGDVVTALFAPATIPKFSATKISTIFK